MPTMQLVDANSTEHKLITHYFNATKGNGT